MQTIYKKCVICVGLFVTLFALALPCFAEVPLRIHSPGIISALPLFWIQEGEYLDEEVDLEIVISPNHQRALSLISRDEIQMMITGVNVGALAYNKGVDIKLLNVNIWGIDYLLTYGFKVDDWKELEGKTLSLPLKGGPLDFVVRYLIQKSGANIEKIKLLYLPLPQGAKYFQNGELDAIVLPEPLLTVTLKKTSQAFLSMDIQKEWGKYHKGDEKIPFVGLFVSCTFAKEHLDILEKFTHLYLEGAKWVNENRDQAAHFAERYLKIPSSIFKEALLRTNFKCIPSRETKGKIEEYFGEILKMYPELVGGRLPDEEFYY